MGAKKQVTLPSELVVKVEERAHSLGISVTEYVQSLVMDDIKHLGDPWYQPLPWEVEKRYLLEEIEFYEAENETPQKAAYSAEELSNLLDKEIRHIDSLSIGNSSFVITKSVLPRTSNCERNFSMVLTCFCMTHPQ